MPGSSGRVPATEAAIVLVVTGTVVAVDVTDATVVVGETIVVVVVLSASHPRRT